MKIERPAVTITMPYCYTTTFSLLLPLLLLSCAPFPLSYAAPPTTIAAAATPRRLLHEPFFPQDNNTPPPPPTSPPPPPALPFTNTSSPFFPSDNSPPSPPPPPPQANTFASFPANISSLILPTSPSSKPANRKLLATAVSSAVAAVLLLCIAVLIKRRSQQRGTNSKDSASSNTSSKPQRSDNANANANGNGNGSVQRQSSKQRRNNASAEFLYLGTIVNPHGVDTHNTNASPGSDPRKLDSPELRPLPPLNRQESRHSYGGGGGGGGPCNVEVASTTGDEEEEFYSPRGSVSVGRESSMGTGSGSRRVFNAVLGSGEDFVRRSSSDSSGSSSSSTSGSGSGSPVRSHSLSPLSLSPPPKSPELTAVVPPREASPRRILLDLEQNALNSVPISSSSPSISASSSPNRTKWNDLDANVLSPSLSPARLSNAMGHSSLSSPRNSNSNHLDQNERSPSRFSASSMVSEKVSEKIQSSPVGLDHHGLLSSSLSSASGSPERVIFKSPVAESPAIDQYKLSPSGSSVISTSPDNVFTKSPDVLPRSESGGLSLNERISSVLERPISVAPPPPPPPPPPPLPPAAAVQIQLESPIASTPKDQPVSRPPSLIPPSRPFVLQSTTMISPIELPQNSVVDENAEETPTKPKLKPLHWDKVRASSDREMVWDQLRTSSFKLNEEMIETLFIVNTPTPKLKQITPRSIIPPLNQENRVLDPKKAQNIAILLRALNVTIEEVCEGLLEGSADTLGTELLESLLKMAPTKEEEWKLREHKDDSPTKLCHAEKFLKAVLDVPSAFQRVEAMLYIANFESEVDYLKKSYETLEAACEELRNSRMFLKLLEAVLKTGNRMNVGTNRGDAQAFKLDTLLKLVDVKGADGKTTLLHFVVQEIIRTEGARLSGSNQTESIISSDDVKCRKLGLQVVSGLSSELTNVKKAAAMDSEVLSSEVAKLSRGIEKISEVVRLNETVGLNGSSSKFSESMNRFMKMAEEEIIRIQALESVAMSLVKEITEYFHGNSAKEEAHPFRIFMVVRDFLGVLDRVCKEVGMINERTIISSAHKFPVPINPTLPPGLLGSNPTKQYSSSDDESKSSP